MKKLIVALSLVFPTGTDQIATGITRLLGQAGATREQIQQFNDARSELSSAPNHRAALQAELKSILSEQQYKRFEEVSRNRGQGQSNGASVRATEGANKWKTAGLGQANTMGGGEATIPKSGKFRVFVLMGQSNMTGAASAKKLKPPYTEKHDRIRIWANGRWEYFVPSVQFGPGVSMAHQLAAYWPKDTIGIIKVASGGTGIGGFEKNWSFERADLKVPTALRRQVGYVTEDASQSWTLTYRPRFWTKKSLCKTLASTG